MDDTAHARGEGEDAVEAVQVRVKWQKQKFDVSVRLHAPVEDFRSQVPPQLQNAKPKQFQPSALERCALARAQSHPAAQSLLLTRTRICQLFELTGVSPERQKITVGAKQITNATDLTSLKLKEKQVRGYVWLPRA